MLEQFEIKTKSRDQLVDITSAVARIIKQSKIDSGHCLIFVPHTTAAITINENADSDVKDDILAKLDDLIAWQDGYKHLEGNSAAHIKASLFGSSETIIIDEGRLVLGTWQGILFAEFDGPRTRKINIKIIED